MSYDQERQAGANFLEGQDPYLRWALDLKARGLAFDTEDDAVDHFKKVLEEFDRFCTGVNKRPGVAKAYAENGAYIRAVLNVGPWSEDGVGEDALIIVPVGAIPHNLDATSRAVINSDANAINGTDATHYNTIARKGHRLKNAMNLLVPEMVEDPNGILPAIVRFETDQIRADREGDLGSLVTVKVSLNGFGGVPEGKLGVL